MKRLTKYGLLIALLPGLLPANFPGMREDLWETGDRVAPQDTLAAAPATKKRKIINARTRAMAAAALCLASGVTAHRYMTRATHAYDRYLNAGNPHDMDRYFDETEALDSKAGYSLAVFEISFLVALFSLLQSLEQ